MTLQLLSPYQMGDLSLKNRIVMAPMTRARAGKERLANALIAEHYAQRASCGLIITEATVISPQGIGWQNTPGIYSDEQMNSWKPVVNGVHEKGGKIFLQLWHTGRASHPDFLEGNLPVAPSTVKLNGEYIHTPQGKRDYVTPRMLETEEVSAIVSDYITASKKALEAGFDGVEIHGANGYLIDTFLSSKTNLRTDKYGGSLANRFRFLQEIVEGVINVFPSQRVGVRISPNGVFNDMGAPDFRETFLYVAQQLNQYNLAYLHVMDGLAFGFHGLGEAMTLTEFRQVFSNTLMGNCGYDKDTAESAIAQGNADLIAFGRPFISNPDLVQRFTHDWPLNPPADPSIWYSFDEKGYNEFPLYGDTNK